MKAYFQKTFALSDQGVEDFIKSIIWSTVLNISYMFPAMLAFYFIRAALFSLEKQETGMEGSMLVYGLLAIVLSVVMFLIAIRQYHCCFSKTYEESARMRISLAEKLRKLPLAFFGKRDIADLSSTIMEDATQIEQLFSHAVPQMYASIISVAFFAVGLTVFHWQMALAMLWVIPVAAAVFFGSRKFQKKAHTEVHGDKLKISETLQEGLDCICEIKAYHYESPYSERLNRLLDAYEQKLIDSELILGALINGAFIPLKLGLVSVVVAGAWMFSNGMVDLFTYIVFMIVSASIYQPIIVVFESMALLMYLSVRINRKKEMDAMPVQQGKTQCSPANFDIEFKDVFFSYDGSTQTINGISFTAKQGEVTALVGPSGGGKSTTTKLAARFWDI
ncbi:MAG: ABC transporter ATP-binding protein, partial [Spirochaetales bacterium]